MPHPRHHDAAPRRLARLLPLLVALPHAHAAPETLDDFEHRTPWRWEAAEGVDAHAAIVTRDDGGHAMRIGWDFSRAAGYVVAAFPLDRELPPNFELAFDLRGDGPPNNLEVKLMGPDGGATVWWHFRRAARWPDAFTRTTSRAARFTHAWGPLAGPLPPRISAIEIAVSADRGGRGWIEIDNLTLTPLPETTPSAGGGTASASAGTLTGTPGVDLTWTVRPADATPDAPATLDLDLAQTVAFNAVHLAWTPPADPGTFTVMASPDPDGDDWSTLATVWNGAGGFVPIFTPDALARRLRIAITPERQATLGAVTLLSPDEVPDRNGHARAIARALPRGFLPRQFLGEQQFWTAVGLPAGEREILLGEDGQVEVRKGGPVIEPFLGVGGRLVTWADVTTTHTLEDGALPIPTVAWTGLPVELAITALASGTPGEAVATVRYRLTNRDARPRPVELILALRPVQVLPWWQRLNIDGGVAPMPRADAGIRGFQLAFHPDAPDPTPGGGLAMGALTRPDGWGAVSWTQGPIPLWLTGPARPTLGGAVDDHGFAASALAWSRVLAPGAVEDIVIQIPLADGATPGQPFNRAPELFLDRLADARAAWNAKLRRVGLDGPAPAAEVFDIVRAQLGAILVNLDGPRIQPGSRTYERSWIRDGSLTGTALLRLGHAERAADFARWYAPAQRADGFVPAIIDHRGPDPIPEHDSHGQLIHLIATHARLTGDASLARELLDHAELARAAINDLRATTGGDGPAFRGLMPASISHEGYSPAQHSHWDNLFALRGLNDLAWLRARLGHDPAPVHSDARRFAADIIASIRLTMERDGDAYIPGCADLGDFDPTSTAIALQPCADPDITRELDAELRRTFDLWWDAFTTRRDDDGWHGFTPYEVRLIGAMVRLGHPERAHELLAWYRRFQHPAGWRHWAEVAYRNPREPAYIGDMPHTWVGSDFINAVLTMIAYEDEPARRLVIGAAIPRDWVADDGLRVTDLRTAHGPLTIHARETADAIEFTVRGAWHDRPDAIEVHAPFDAPVEGDRVRTITPAPDGPATVRFPLRAGG